MISEPKYQKYAVLSQWQIEELGKALLRLTGSFAVKMSDAHKQVDAPLRYRRPFFLLARLSSAILSFSTNGTQPKSAPTARFQPFTIRQRFFFQANAPYRFRTAT